MSATLESGWAIDILGFHHETPRQKIAVEKIVAAVQLAFALPDPADVLRCHHRHRFSPIKMEARRVAMMLMREYTPLSFPRIAMLFGLTDHTTVIYHCQRATKRERSDIEYATFLHTLREELVK